MRWVAAALLTCSAGAVSVLPNLTFSGVSSSLTILAPVFLALPANAGDRNRDDRDDDWSRDMEDQRRQSRENEREAAKQAREFEREQQKEENDRAREQQKAEQERARDEQRQDRSSERVESTREQQSQDNGSSSDHGGDTRSDQSTATSGQSSNSSGGTGGRDNGDDAGRQGGHRDDGNSDRGGSRQNASGNAGSSPDVDVEAGQIEDSQPPKTLLQWFNGIAAPKPEQATPKNTQSNKPGPVKRGPEKADSPKSSPAKPRSGGIADLPHLPGFTRPEVLAVNASAKSVARAKALGFKASSATQLQSLNYAVTKLQAPAGLTGQEAEALLAKELPSDKFSVNQSYYLYRTATGKSAELKPGNAKGEQLPAARSGNGVSCGIDHCFGRDIVGWRPSLKGCVAGLKVGIIDTSVDVTHPAFVHKKIEVSHLGRGGTPGPDWHGTGVTSLLAGDAASGTPGLIPDANFYVADVFQAGADGLPVSDTLSMLRAFNWLESKNVKLINMSLSGPPEKLIAEAIVKLSAKGIVIVAAAGNDGPGAAPSYPAAYDNVIAVTAVGKDLKSYRHANHGSYIDVAAPGVAIWTAQPGSKEGYHSGTSFAAPYVTAALAAISQRLPAKSSPDVLKLLEYRDLGAPGPDPVYGQGLLMAPKSCDGDRIAAAPAQPAKVANTLRDTNPPALVGVKTSETAKPVEVLPWQQQ